jgi:hypothetical protein
MCKHFNDIQGEPIVTLLHFARDLRVPELTVGTRYLHEQLSAYGLKDFPSEGCLSDFVHNALDATVRTQQQGETTLSCLHRHLHARARFLFLWMSSNAPDDPTVWEDRIAIAQNHAVPRTGSPARQPSER